ncbi:hypothetical protein GCM10022226_36060 [Sphaerisporangium flaviroseum]|uniref:Outer membrane channel protein CpnT-like N-terminal domain-containing protein n=1 Tax=Sphaerisporangium flaviroseum TaxID=509199 RepID=A0ABP7I8J2_9ACTN
MSPSPLTGFKRLADTRPVATTLTVGAVTHGAFVTAMLAVEWPEGDPDRLRQAATIFDELARKIDEGLVAADEAAVRVWLDNFGPGVEAFRQMWRGVPSGPPGSGAPAPEGFSGYPADVVAYCRRVAAACRAYADSLETIRHVLIVLAVQAWANMLFTSMYGWTTAGVAKLVQKQIMERFFQRLAQSQLKIFKISITKIISTGFYYTLDSLTYAGIQQGLQLAIYAASGVRTDLQGRDVLSAETNAIQFGQAFVANLAFEAVWDGSKLIPGGANMVFDRIWVGGKLVPGGARGNRFGDFTSRMAGSATYSVVANLFEDPTGNPVPTDWQTWAAKLLTHGVRSIKPS